MMSVILKVKKRSLLILLIFPPSTDNETATTVKITPRMYRNRKTCGTIRPLVGATEGDTIWHLFGKGLCMQST